MRATPARTSKTFLARSGEDERYLADVGIGRHALFLPGILQEEFRREYLWSVWLAFPEKIEVPKDGWVVMFFHDRAADTVNTVHFRVPTCSDG